jgi:hypothetical protein
MMTGFQFISNVDTPGPLLNQNAPTSADYMQNANAKKAKSPSM